MINSAIEKVANAEEYNSSLSEILVTYDDVLEEIVDPLSNVTQLQKITEYLNVVQDIDKLR